MLTGNDIDNYDLENLDRANHQGSPNNKSQTNPTHLLVSTAHRYLSVFVNVVSRCDLFPKARILDTPGFVNTRGPPPRSQKAPQEECRDSSMFASAAGGTYMSESEAMFGQNGEHPGYWSRYHHDTEGLSLSAIKCSVAPSTPSSHPQLSTI